MVSKFALGLLLGLAGVVTAVPNNRELLAGKRSQCLGLACATDDECKDCDSKYVCNYYDICVNKKSCKKIDEMCDPDKNDPRWQCCPGAACLPVGDTFECKPTECLKDEECSGPTPFCDVDARQCVECFDDTQCSGICDLDSNTCVDPCVGVECPLVDCPGTPISRPIYACNPKSGVCDVPLPVPPCPSPCEYCVAGEVCINDVCQPDPCKDCPETCLNGTTCVECLNDDQCPEACPSGPGPCIKYVCDLTTYTCVDPCAGKSCPEGTVCLNGDCVDPCIFTLCPEDTKCVAGDCIPLACKEPNEPCTKTEECCEGGFCDKGYCVFQYSITEQENLGDGENVVIDGPGGEQGSASEVISEGASDPFGFFGRTSTLTGGAQRTPGLGANLSRGFAGSTGGFQLGFTDEAKPRFYGSGAGFSEGFANGFGRNTITGTESGSYTIGNTGQDGTPAYTAAGSYGDSVSESLEGPSETETSSQQGSTSTLGGLGFGRSAGASSGNYAYGLGNDGSQSRSGGTTDTKTDENSSYSKSTGYSGSRSYNWGK